MNLATPGYDELLAAMSIRDRLQNEGYAVIRQAIPQAHIERVLQSQQQSRRNPLLIFRGQGVVGYERAHWNAQGQMVRSIQNPHLLGFAPGLSGAIHSLIFSQAVAEAFTLATGSERWVNWQTMLFDRSVGTDIHLDTWFLDTKPRGALLGAWIALENIKPDSGPFIVYPKSHRLSIISELSNHANLQTRRDRLMQALNDHEIKPVQLLLNKGDMILWSSLLAHGSELPASGHETRKSVTAHFYPYGMEANAPPIRRLISIYNHKKPSKEFGSNLFKAATISPLLYSSLCTIMLALQQFRKKTGSTGSIRRVRDTLSRD